VDLIQLSCWANEFSDASPGGGGKGVVCCNAQLSRLGSRKAIAVGNRDPESKESS
jgi:hypothetical protein